MNRPKKKKKLRREDLGVRVEDLPKFPDGSPMLPGDEWWTMTATASEQIQVARMACENERIAETARQDLAEIREELEAEANARLSR